MFDYFYGQSGEMFSYFRVPKILFRDIKFKDLSTDAKTLYGILLDRMGLSVKNGWLDEQGRVYIIFPVQEVMDALGCADNKATKLFRELEKFGLIERKRRGLGKPNLIYVKNFADPRFRNREKNGSGAADSAQQETAKSRGNKTEWNKTEGSEPDPFSSDAESEPNERTRLKAYFMQSLEVDLLLRACPDEEDTIHQIVNLLVDTCSSKRRMLRVAGDDKPAEVVRSRFMKLNRAFGSAYFLELGLSCQQLEQNIPALFTDPACGHGLRAKGFVQDENGWVELNATADGLTVNAIPKGQEVLIVIGEGLEKERIEVRLKG
ncbi:replication initiator protein A [Faecalibacterium wellingii]|uniref:Replication initiator protein A n=1 Tax=Faecalibacterium wellingii TaxID=2929491 RepID=A0ABU3TXH2_9FIRM|nr:MULTISPECIES: replication initiator protein A [Faecalibacterium]MDU8687975.1 replication initiator protein A [Faecalibacterium prausnitzii]UQK55915.1 replication initiator protein A [Faecalibacterium sp. HTF-F]